MTTYQISTINKRYGVYSYENHIFNRISSADDSIHKSIQIIKNQVPANRGRPISIIIYANDGFCYKMSIVPKRMTRNPVGGRRIVTFKWQPDCVFRFFRIEDDYKQKFSPTNDEFFFKDGRFIGEFRVFDHGRYHDTQMLMHHIMSDPLNSNTLLNNHSSKDGNDFKTIQKRILEEKISFSILHVNWKDLNRTEKLVCGLGWLFCIAVGIFVYIQAPHMIFYSQMWINYSLETYGYDEKLQWNLNPSSTYDALFMSMNFVFVAHDLFLGILGCFCSTSSLYKFVFRILILYFNIILMPNIIIWFIINHVMIFAMLTHPVDSIVIPLTISVVTFHNTLEAWIVVTTKYAFGY